MAECMTMMGSTREAVANTLAFLQLDLTDPDFRRHALAGSRGMHRGLRALVKDAVAAGEIVPCDAGRLASALQATIDGSLRSWAIHGDGTLAAWLRRDLKTVLELYRRRRRS